MNYDSVPSPVKNLELDMLHEIGNRIAAADPLPEVLGRVVEVISAVVESDSCFVYVLEGNELVLRASKNPHSEVVDRLKLRVGQGITGWLPNIKDRWLSRAMLSRIHGSDRLTNCPRTATKHSSLYPCYPETSLWES
jgi:uroporphyrinogen-III synthase